MRLIAVVGSGSGAGKTTVACRILAEVPGLAAVKISPREGSVGVEWGPGEPGKDTARYAACGAVKVARIVGPRSAVARVWRAVERELVGVRGAVVEGAGALRCRGEKLTIVVISPGHLEERRERSGAILAAADLLVMLDAHRHELDSATDAIISHHSVSKPVHVVSSSPTDGDGFDHVRRAASTFLSR